MLLSGDEYSDFIVQETNKNDMGARSSKTHPLIRGVHSPSQSSGSNQLSDVDAKLADIRSPTTNDTSAIRKQRSPGETPDLYVYLSYKNWELARKQIEQDRGLAYVSTNRRFSVLHVAIENNAPVHVVQLMLSKGIDPNVIETLFQQSPLHTLMKMLGDENSFKVLEALTDAGADVNTRAKYGRTILYFAIKYRAPTQAIMYLLRAGTLVSREDLIFAKEKAMPCVAILVEKVAVLSSICSSKLPRTGINHSGKPAVGTLPVDLFRSLATYLFPSSPPRLSQY